MLKKTMTYTDYDGNTRTEDFYFNLSKAEIVEMEMGVSGGLEAMINRIVAAKDAPQIMSTFKNVILKAYGEKSPDGKYFNKSDAISAAFAQTEAYSDLFMELLADSKAAADFINAIVPNASEEDE